MSPEGDAIWIWIAGFLATLYAGAIVFIHTSQRGRTKRLEENQQGYVTDKTSIERFKHVTDRMDDFKEDISKLYGISTKQGISLASIDTKLDLIVENSARRRKGD